jgi:hypothetical protein
MKTINNSSKKTGIIFALFILLAIGLTTSCKKSTCNYSPCTVRDSINVSTGLDSIGKANIAGGIDYNWEVISSPYLPLTTAKTTLPFPGFWQPTPIVGTNATWINCSGTTSANLAGNYIFERSFTIAPGTISFTCDFGVICDDILGPVQIISPPVTVATTVPVVPTTTYYLSNNIGTVFTNPTPGVWKIRATVKFVDNVGGFLTSGFIKTLKPC